MAIEDFWQEGDVPEEELPRWRPPVMCPQCNQTQTRFVMLKYEMSVYACELCGIQFEVDEGEG